MSGQLLEPSILAEIIEPLITYPGLISYLDADIADELIERGLFCLKECSVTAAGRDLLSRLVSVT